MLNYILEFIERNQDSVIIVILVAAVQLYIANRFQKKLESHKGDVNREIEGVKHKQQKALKEFDLYSTKRYQIYPELYKEVDHAYREMIGLRGVFHAVDLRQFDESEIEEYLRSHDFNNKDVLRIKTLFNVRKDEAIDLIRSKLQEQKYYRAGEIHAKALDFFKINELFLTDEIATVTHNLLQKMYEYWIDLHPDYRFDLDIRKQAQDIRENLPDLLDEFKNMLKADLRKAFSE